MNKGGMALNGINLKYIMTQGTPPGKQKMIPSGMNLAKFIKNVTLKLNSYSLCESLILSRFVFLYFW